jgi:BirA family biotin operon repressor/biotin-[acetyl-CoA-carboxylase] ligase
VRELARAGAPPWTVVVAGRQTAGRGRQGRSWVSASGNLFVSVLIRPPEGCAWLSLLPLAAGIAVCDAARAFGADARLKWPNDVLVGNRKLAGILAEAQSSGGGVEAVVVGLGVNVGQRGTELDPGLRDTVATLADAGAVPAVSDVAAPVLRGLRGWYDALAAGRSSEVLAAWRERAVTWWGHPVEVRCGNEIVVGRVVALANDGALVLETAQGPRRIVAGDARELRPRE